MYWFQSSERATSDSHRALAFAAAVWICLALPNCARSTAPPNVVLIFADDQSWNGTSVQMDPGVDASKSDFYQTPSLERISTEGMRFSSAYSAQSTCSPTRAALITGKSPAQLGINDLYYDGFVRGFSEHPLTAPQVEHLSPSEVGLGTRVKQAPAGYTTALIGKWHIEGASPYDMGFDYYTVATDNSPTDHQSVTAKTNAAVSFMSDAVANNNPFFVMISHNALHRPIDPNPDTLAKYEALEPGTRHTSASYAAYTEDLDRGVGLLLDSLEDLGIDENTYVIYTSDNGPEKTDSPVKPLYMAKKSIFEGGIRMPFLVSGPGIEANSVSDVPVTTIDLYSTISSLVGTEGPLPTSVEGASLTPLFFNGGALPGDMPHLERTHAEDGAIFFMQPTNIATDPVYRLRPAAAVRRGDYKLVRFFGENGGDDIDMLFNLADYSAPFTETEFLNDPLNLADDFPELTQELAQILEGWFDSADVSLPFDVSAPTEIAWSAGHQGDSAQVWRSVTDVDQKYRESWYLPETSAHAPELTAVTAFQPGLSDAAFRFDGDDQAGRQFFYVSDDLPRLSSTRFPTGTADFDRSVSFEFWVKLEDLQDDHLLLEAGNPDQGLSISIGDDDLDGDHDDLRFQLVGVGAETELAVTGDIARFANAARDFIQVVAVFNDSSSQRKANIYVNGHRIATADGLMGDENSIDWDQFVQGFSDASLGYAESNELGGNGGTDNLPFDNSGLRGELAEVKFYNYAIDDDKVLDNYNSKLDPVNYGVVSAAGNVAVASSRPSSVTVDAFEATHQVIVLEERRDRLDADLQVDQLVATGAAGTLANGTEFVSYLLHFDPEVAPLPQEFVFGSITFSGEILGLIYEDQTLNQTDALLGAIGEYAEGNRGPELANGNMLTVSDDRHKLTFDFSVEGADLIQVRLLTSLVLAGDYNADGTVDAADYTLWQDNLGGDSSVLSGNGSGAATVVQADYELWKTDFGNTTASSSAAELVPEPTTLLLALLGLASVPLRMRHGQSANTLC